MGTKVTLKNKMGFLKYLYKEYKDFLQAMLIAFAGPLLMFGIHYVTGSLKVTIITGFSIMLGVFATYCIILPLIAEYDNYKKLKK